MNEQDTDASRLFTALSNTADGAFIIDKDQRIVFWNQAAQKILGYTPDEAIGRLCYDVLRGRNDKGRMTCRTDCRITTTALSGEVVANYDTCARTRSGKVRWINVSTLTVPSNDNSNHSMIVHLFRNVAEKKQQELFVQQVLDAANLLQDQSTPGPNASASTNAPSQILTDREREVLTLLVNGLNTRDIAHSLSISSSTARNHIQNIFHKLQVHSRLEAVAYALKHGLVARN